MVKETQQRLIRALKILREPSGSTVPAIVHMVNKDEPQISLKDIVKTLQGCLKTGIMTRCRDRIRLKHSVKSCRNDEDLPSQRDASEDKMSRDFSQHETTPLPDGDIKIRQKCEHGMKPKPKSSKPKNTKSKPKCPKPKPKRSKKKADCPKSKGRSGKKKSKPKAKRPKIQPYCKKQPPPNCPDHSNAGDR